MNSGEKKDARLLLLGLDNSGKTTIIRALSDENILLVSPTQGFNVKSLSQAGLKLTVWDVGGQKSIRGYWRNYFNNTDGIVSVFHFYGASHSCYQFHSTALIIIFVHCIIRYT